MLAIHIPVNSNYILIALLPEWILRWQLHFQSWLYTPVFYFHPLLLFFPSQNQQCVFSFARVFFPAFIQIFSLVASFSLISCLVLNLIHPLKFSWSSWEGFLFVGIWRALCHSLLLRFSHFVFLFLLCFSSFPFYPPTFELSSKYLYDIYRRSTIWIVLCLVFPLEISQAVTFLWYYHWH